LEFVYKGPAISAGAEVSEKPVIAEESIAMEEPRAMEKIERVEMDDPSQPQITSVSLMTLGERVEMQPGSSNIMIPALKIPECSPTIGPLSGKILIIEVPRFKYCPRRLKLMTMILAMSLLLMMLANSPI